MPGGNRHPWWTALLVGIVLVNLGLMPLTAVWGFRLVGPLNPNRIPFSADFQLQNMTGESVHVTPVACTKRVGERVLLPMYKGDYPSFPAKSRHDLLIRPGESLTVFYDWDDCVLSEVIVRLGSGELKQITVADFGTEGIADYREEATTVRIEELDTLSDVEEAVVAPLRRVAGAAPRDEKTGLSMIALLVHVVSVFAVVMMLRWRLKHKATG